MILSDALAEVESSTGELGEADSDDRQSYHKTLSSDVSDVLEQLNQLEL